MSDTISNTSEPNDEFELQCRVTEATKVANAVGDDLVAAVARACQRLVAENAPHAEAMVARFVADGMDAVLDELAAELDPELLARYRECAAEEERRRTVYDDYLTRTQWEARAIQELGTEEYEWLQQHGAETCARWAEQGREFRRRLLGEVTS